MESNYFNGLMEGRGTTQKLEGPQNNISDEPSLTKNFH